MADAYKRSGVDIDAGILFAQMIQERVRTAWPADADNIGGFSGGGEIPFWSKLVSGSVDGVGTKLKLAFWLDRHDTVGIDAGAMSFVDLYMDGYLPLYAWDYLAMHRSEPTKHIAIIEGLIDGCLQVGCRLLGGETAELNTMYHPGEYDLAVFSIGFPNPGGRLVPKENIKPGMTIWGWLSDGPGSNGFSLIRQTFGFEAESITVEERLGKLNTIVPDTDITLGETLLQPTKIYIRQMEEERRRNQVIWLGHAHITGGGMVDNIPRVLPNDCKAVVDRSLWKRPAIFPYIQETGGIDDDEMNRVFNQGIQVVSFSQDNRSPKDPNCIAVGVVEKRTDDESQVQFTGNFLDL